MATIVAPTLPRCPAASGIRRLRAVVYYAVSEVNGIFFGGH
ncbi:hypothetical protein [Kitasatospora sp. NPDC056531]